MDSLKEKLCIRRLDKVYCKLAPSKIHGVGIFAIRKIPKSTNPFKGSYMHTDAILCDYHKLDQPESIKTMLNYKFPRSSEKVNKQIIPMFPNQLSWIDFLNYSKEPNIELLESGEWVTMKDINEGEELLEDPSKLFKENGDYKPVKVTPNQYLNLKF